MKVLSFGSMNVDHVYHVPHIALPGETIASGAYSVFPGGKGLNQSIALARAGLDVWHAGKLGSQGLFLKGLLDGTFNYYSAEHDSIEVKIGGDSAVMIGKSRVLAAVYGGRKHCWKLRGDFTLRRENGTWLLTGSRASTY